MAQHRDLNMPIKQQPIRNDGAERLVVYDDLRVVDILEPGEERVYELRWVRVSSQEATSGEPRRKPRATPTPRRRSQRG